MKVAILWYALTGYLNSCLKALANIPEVEIFVVHKKAHSQAPYEAEQFAWIKNQFYWTMNEQLADLPTKLQDFEPDVIISVGWSVPEYRNIARLYRHKAIRILTMDNNWRNTPRQWFGIASAPFHIQKLADAVWVPGERQAAFAERLGFSQAKIIRGLYSCDRDAFNRVYEERIAAGRPLPERFIFVGRFVKEKGVETLATAYRKYRQRVANPWPLICCGIGPLQHLLDNQPGIQVEGFVQPGDLPNKLSMAGSLLLPSLFEPWALVVHEAAAAGLAILASSHVGATAHLVQHNYNGYVFDPDDSDALADRMVMLGNTEKKKLELMSSASSMLSQQFSPQLWADSLIRFSSARLSGSDKKPNVQSL